jgi:hypothetical protein
MKKRKRRRNVNRKVREGFNIEKVRKEIATYLLHHGEQNHFWGDDLAALLGLSLEEWYEAAFNCNLFTFDRDDHFGWCLTPQGRKALAA